MQTSGLGQLRLDLIGGVAAGVEVSKTTLPLVGVEVGKTALMLVGVAAISGDQAGPQSRAGLLVRRVTPLPSAFIT